VAYQNSKPRLLLNVKRGKPIPAIPAKTKYYNGIIKVLSQSLAAASTGKLGPDDAAAVMALLTAQAKLVEQSEVIARLEAIEQWLAKGKP